MNLLRLVARPLIATPFIVVGVSAMRNPSAHAEQLKKVTPLLETLGVPPVLASDARFLSRTMGAVTTVAATGLALGKAPRVCAGVLTAVAVPIALVQNPVWTAKDRDERNRYRRGLERYGAALGGVILATTDRVGAPSASWRLAAWRDHKADLVEARNATWEAAKETFDN
ncbi:MAG: DoxX family membrane protein [Actinomycetaceae bacterium]|nr:DoxX family membrane protein [Actinomycetaceae bacterium]